MWVLEIVDQSTRNSLDQFGINPRDIETAGHIMLAPWLHFGWGHLIANSGPFFVLGLLTYIAGFARWLMTTITSVVVSGVTVWLTAPAGSITAGVSGLVFGYLTYLLIRGFFTRRLGQIALAVVILLVYGSILVGVLPTASGVSWQGHLGGAVGGGLAAWLQFGRKRDVQQRV
ncbi:MAG: rhomboid family intramembrane serine protease [Arachnia sp.]